jgi:FMN phosphatase YigB (HAD superfamily)
LTNESRLTFLLDVDNTLIDNDAAKRAIDDRLRAFLGDAETERFWTAYEAIRAETGVVNYPLTMARFHQEASSPVDRTRRYAPADLIMGFPYETFLYPDALTTIAHLRTIGRVAILSDGDPTYQPAKIARSGLAAAVDGYVLVYAHKQEHLAEVTAAFPADHYVLVEDKPSVITAMRARLQAPLTTVLVRQGKYAAEAGPGPWPGAHLTLDRIGDLRDLAVSAFLRPAAAPSSPATVSSSA